MRIGILSDTHDQLLITQRAVQLLQRQGAETLIHCGDLTTPEIVHACAILPCIFALGNNDDDNIPALEHAIAAIHATSVGTGAILPLAAKQMAILHGHVRMKSLSAQHPDYLIHGHSHIPADTRLGPTRRICPGALYRAKRFTVALLDTESDELRFLQLERSAYP